MLTDKQVIEFIEKRQIEKYFNGDRTPKVLNAVLDYLDKNNDNSLMNNVFGVEKNINCFIALDNGLERLKNIAVNTRLTYYAYTLMKYLDFAGKEELEDLVIKTGDAEYILNFAKDISGANIEKLEDAIIRIKDAKYIYLFAMRIEKANIEKLEDSVINIGDAEYIYKFAKDIENANIEKLEDAIIKIGDAKYIYNFAKNISGANIEKLEDGIIKTKNAEYIYKFAQYINGANIEKIEKALGEIKDEQYIDLLKNNKKLMKLKQRQILIKKQISEGIIPFAMTILLEKKDKEKILDELIENINDKDSLLKLKVYINFLNSSIKDLEKAYEFDKEYTEYVKKKNKTSNQ